MDQPTEPPTVPPNWPAANYAQAMALIESLPSSRTGHADEKLARAQVYAVLAVADMLDALDTAVRDLHETLRGRGDDRSRS